MKTNSLLYLLALSIFFFPTQNFAQKDFSTQDFPSYKSVVQYFYKNYNAPETNEQFYFEKRPEGYFVSMSFEYPFNVRKKREMLWSYESKTFQKLKQYYSGSASLENLKWNSPFLRPYNSHEFNFCAFAGYPGWQSDVIKYFGEKENLSDTLLYGLGRAYSTLASNLVSGSYGNIDPTIQFNLPKGKNSMNSQQLTEFRKNANLARTNFLKLHQQNPDFETVVGKNLYKIL